MVYKNSILFSLFIMPAFSFGAEAGAGANAVPEAPQLDTEQKKAAVKKAVSGSKSANGLEHSFLILKAASGLLVNTKVTDGSYLGFFYDRENKKHAFITTPSSQSFDELMKTVGAKSEKLTQEDPRFSLCLMLTQCLSSKEQSILGATEGELSSDLQTLLTTVNDLL